LGTLGGGQIVALGLAAQLLHRPDVLLLDEATNILDLVGVQQLETALQAYRGAFVVVSHDERRLTELGSGGGCGSTTGGYGSSPPLTATDPVRGGSDVGGSDQVRGSGVARR